MRKITGINKDFSYRFTIKDIGLIDIFSVLSQILGKSVGIKLVEHYDQVANFYGREP